jgi:hypothetical protein
MRSRTHDNQMIVPLGTRLLERLFPLLIDARVVPLQRHHHVTNLSYRHIRALSNPASYVHMIGFDLEIVRSISLRIFGVVDDLSNSFQ